MKFSLDAALLVKVFRKLKGVIGKSRSMPILGSVLIEARGNSVIFSATDLELGVEITERGAFVENEGSAVLPIEKALKLLCKLKGQVSLESAADNAIVVRCLERKSKTTLAGSPRDEYPTLPAVPKKKSEVDAGALGAALTAVLHAVSKDEKRYNLNGVYINSDSKDTVRVVATDGHRLALADAGEMALPWKGGIIVPLKGATYLANFLKGEAQVTVAQGDKVLRVSGDSGAVSIRLIEGEFPNYNQVIPTEIGETVTADTEQFKAALETAYELSPERSKAVKLVLRKGLEFRTENPDFGDSVVECPCKRSGEKDWALVFNGKYLIEAISAVCGDQVTIELATKDPELSPIRISGGQEFPFCIVMPMRV